ncbi:hypothetical protein Cob_v013055 [Colletotrichum orbiculare MAFF 240422]|uniref:Uncharacterized protein n=1 Tax=Colletotrichum orbiculare (strain 104-T / ATCC 96160 / CBS 514.97 / LARS 414 / MAFF 240422) TaxID=1213857 RepID=A0A484F723_COLOR|nr:hypothetical protein Cob_v013055 [Colletotrichum orbiculare MAFF 240422]
MGSRGMDSHKDKTLIDSEYTLNTLYSRTLGIIVVGISKVPNTGFRSPDPRHINSRVPCGSISFLQLCLRVLRFYDLLNH